MEADLFKTVVQRNLLSLYKYTNLFIYNAKYDFAIGLGLSLAYPKSLVTSNKRKRPVLEIIKLELILKLKIKCNDWLLVDTCPQAANNYALF